MCKTLDCLTIECVNSGVQGVWKRQNAKCLPLRVRIDELRQC